MSRILSKFIGFVERFFKFGGIEMLVFCLLLLLLSDLMLFYYDEIGRFLFKQTSLIDSLCCSL